MNLVLREMRKQKSTAKPIMDSKLRTRLFQSIFLLPLFLSVSESNQFCDAGIGYCESECGLASASPSKILIKGGTVVNAHHQQVADVYIEDGIIAAVQSNFKVGDDVTVIDAMGKYVMPGGIDPHTHLAMEFMGTETIDDFFSGQAAALAGGTTMHIDFIIPVNGSLSAGYEAYVDKAKKSCMDYGFHMAITKWDETVSKEMEIMVKDKGINSFKFFLAYKGSLMINDELLLEGFKKCKSLGALAMVHAENGDAVFEGQKRMIELGITGPEGHALSRPPMIEGEATSRAIRLAGFVNTPLYVVHVMSIDAMEEIARARKSGKRVIGEPVVSGLVLDDSCLWNPDFKMAAKFVMSPPIRGPGHGKALQAALSTGILQLVGTDHCTFNSTQKTLGIDDFRKIPNGVNGLEERMHIVWDSMVVSGQISVTDYVRLTSTECAKIFNIYPRKGAILVGSDADIIILNPNSSFEISSSFHHSRSDTNVYEGRRGKGKVEVTIAGGRIVWENDELKVVPGSGKYIKMQPFVLMAIKVHGGLISTATMRVLACLEEKELEYEFVPVNLRAGEAKREPFLSLNPFGQVPALEDGDLKLFESRAITKYIAYKYANKGTPLISQDPKEMAMECVWMEVEAQIYENAASKLTWELCIKPKVGLTTDEAVVEEYEEKLAKVLDVYEDRLAKSKYLGGNCFSLADFHHLPTVNYLMGTKIKALFDSRIYVNTWCADILARPAWKKVFAMKDNK